MKSTRYESLDVPIKLHLDFTKITVGELSNIMRDWQALLRCVWRESYALQYPGRIPSPRILVVTASTENSFEIISDIAIHTLFFGTAFLGPVRNWPNVAKQAHGYLREVWLQKAARSGSSVGNHVYMRGGDSPEVIATIDALQDSEAGARLERMWDRANRGEIELTIEELDDDNDD
ncbi:MAG: hypothetical protein OXD31_15015 [Chloroflexi bacterium]|nr:hypothetical protein [Chloroflexota bacterium]